MDNGFIFGGRSTQDFGISVEKYPEHVGAARRFETIIVPGRNGKLHRDDGSYENVPKNYACYFRGNRPTPEQSHAISVWLQGIGTYRRLEDPYDPDYYRMAICTNALTIENILNRYGRFTAMFDCMPQVFLKSGEYPVSLGAPGKLHNPTGMPALPLITVRGTAAGTLTVGNCAVEIKSLEDVIVLDSDTQNAYRQTAAGAFENKNDCIYAPVFPALEAGENLISWTGGIQSVEIIPRWWTL